MSNSPKISITAPNISPITLDSSDKEILKSRNKRNSRGSPRGELSPRATIKNPEGEFKHQRLILNRSSKTDDKYPTSELNVSKNQTHTNDARHQESITESQNDPRAYRPTLVRRNRLPTKPAALDSVKTCLNHLEPKTLESFHKLLFKRCMDTFVDPHDQALIQLSLVNKYYKEKINEFLRQFIKTQYSTSPAFSIFEGLSENLEDIISWFETSFCKTMMLYFNALHNQDEPSDVYRTYFNVCIKKYFLNPNLSQIFCRNILNPQEYFCQLMPQILENLESNQLEFRVFGLSILLKLPLIPKITIDPCHKLLSLLIQIIMNDDSKPRSNALEVWDEKLALEVLDEKFLNQGIKIPQDLLDQLIPLLINRVKDDQYTIRLANLSLLEQFLYQETTIPEDYLIQLIPLAIEALNDNHQAIQVTALSIVTLLKKLGVPIPDIYINNFIPLLVTLLQCNQYWQSRANALGHLTLFILKSEDFIINKIITNEMLGTLIALTLQALTDDRWELRKRAFVFLGMLEEKGLLTNEFDYHKTISLTIKALKDDIWQVQSPALWFFSRLLKYDVTIFKENFNTVLAAAIAAIEKENPWPLKMAAFNLFAIIVAKDFINNKDFFENLISLSIEETENEIWSVRGSALWVLELILTRNITIPKDLEEKINKVTKDGIGDDEENVEWHPRRLLILGKGIPIPQKYLDIPLENKFAFLADDCSDTP